MFEFVIEQIVYLKTDADQLPRIVTGIEIRPGNSITYALSECEKESWHYGFEISTEKDILFSLAN